jgi:Putative transposase, YhgA-like
LSDFDSPWKEALDKFLPLFLAFFFPKIYAAVDWSKGYESLDKELQQAMREGELGLRLADKLFRVYRKDGQEAWVLIHIEVQNQPDVEFAERMYVYNYRIYDNYHRPVVSLAVLGDDRPQWRPNVFRYELWGCTVLLEFPVVKLLDYAPDLASLEADANPFGLVVIAHLQTAATRKDATTRKHWKTRVVKGLFDRGLQAEEIRQLFRLIDWMMELPKELENQFSEEIRLYQEEKKMPYVTSIERLALEKGLEQGRQEGRREGRREGRQEGRQEGEAKGLREGIALALEIKFGAAGLELVPAIEKLENLTALRDLRETIKTAVSVKDLCELLN